MKPKEVQIPENKLLKHVYFRVESGYMKKSSVPFYDELKVLFSGHGYVWEDSGYDTIYLIKERTKLYCHPQNLSGPVMTEHVYEIANILLSGKTFEYLKTDISKDIYAFTPDEELSFYKQKYGHMMQHMIRQEFTTTSRKQYLPKSLLNDLARNIEINTPDHYTGSSDSNPVFKFIGEIYNELVELGHIIETTKRIGCCNILYCRTALHKELNLTKVPLFAYVGTGDFIWCNECEEFQLLPHGADKCPRCEEVGKMRWFDEERQEFDISEIDTSYFQIIRKKTSQHPFANSHKKH